MPEEENVRIESWPPEPAKLEHHFVQDSPCPVRIAFDDTAANVVVRTAKGDPLDVDMNMNLSVREAIPVCIKLCEPICAQSDYRIGIDIFDRPVASISIKGLTRLFNCREMPPTRNCTDFKRLPAGQQFSESLRVEELTFTGAGPLRTVTYGDPAGQVKLGFPEKGVSIEFPGPASDIEITLSNYGNPDLEVEAFRGPSPFESQKVSIQNGSGRVSIKAGDITRVEIRGGSNEASIVEVCYTLSSKSKG